MTRIDTNELKSRTNIIDVISKHVPLTKKGSEYFGVCPFHNDHKKSLQVNEKKQIFKCFACDEGGDSIEFLTRLGINFHDAINEINGGPINETNFIQNKTEIKEKTEWNVILKPDSFENMDFNHYNFGMPNKKWCYRDKSGNPITFVCRFNHKDGTKSVLPFSYAEKNNYKKWLYKGIPENRPLYNLHLLHKYKNATVIIVEGEKTADAGQNEVDCQKIIFTTWIGGANAIKKTDFTPLTNRNVILFPDNDKEQKYGDNHPLSGKIKPYNEQPGNLAMIKINDIIKDYSSVHGFVKNTDDKPNKWDCADTDWKPGELKDYIRKNLNDVPEKPIIDKPQPKKEIKKTIFHFENDYFRLLGFDKDEKSSLVYYFYSFGAKSVVKFSPKSMNKSNLLQIAPLMYWEHEFPGQKTSFNAAAAAQFLISNSHKIGIFKEKYIRGRGAWIDDKKIVIHTGEKILKENNKIPLDQFKSNYCYEIGENLGFGYSDPLEVSESSKILDILSRLDWERPANAHLLAGWCVLAPFCGVLNWRPHIWITGPAGSGKSWTMEKVVKTLMGETGVVVQGKTTEAGVRGLLQSDARPVLFDESDVDDIRDIDRIQSILALARSASYSDGGGIVKGTQTGSARTYIIRSMFALSSIGVQVQKQSDRSRFTVLGFKPNDVSKKLIFEKTAIDWLELCTNEFVNRLQSRTLKLIPTIIANSKVFSDAAGTVIGSQRTGDQIGGMLAGAFSLKSNKIIDIKEAIEIVKSIDWTEEKGLDATKDEVQLLSIITSNKLRVETELMTVVERSIGELILIASNNTLGTLIDNKKASDLLKRNGILVIDDKFLVANTAPEIKKMIKDTSWRHNHSKILERIDGAEKINPRQFNPGLNSRSVSLPISLLQDKQKTIEVEQHYVNDDLNDDEIPF